MGRSAPPQTAPSGLKKKNETGQREEKELAEESSGTDRQTRPRQRRGDGTAGAKL